jgi:single-strand DNA-binding protein
MDINTGLVIGRLTADPEYSEHGEMQFCNLRIAVNHGRTNADGSEKPAYFFDVKTFGKTATACRDYLAKGKRVGVVYELRHETWETDDGSKRSKVVLGAQRVQFLTERNGNGEQTQITATPAEVTSQPVADDDIPF